LTIESTTDLLLPWGSVPAGQLTPNSNPIPAGSKGAVAITPGGTGNTLFIRMRANTAQ
jgi:hypothetical protein